LPGPTKKVTNSRPYFLFLYYVRFLTLVILVWYGRDTDKEIREKGGRLDAGELGVITKT
jgi:hypothetical protein